MRGAEEFELVYFNLDGRALQIRLLFALAECPFIDKRISRGDWAALKKDTPWGHLPILVHQGTTHFDSVAIMQHVASELGLWPTSTADKTRSLGKKPRKPSATFNLHDIDNKGVKHA